MEFFISYIAPVVLTVLSVTVTALLVGVVVMIWKDVING